jgi:CRP-like cAMP-binding protein
MSFEKLRSGIRTLVSYSESEFDTFIQQCQLKTFQRNEILFEAGEVCNRIIFINEGLTRSMISDSRGGQHTILFSMEGDFVGDFSSYLKIRPSTFSIQAVERVDGIIIPRETIESAFQNLKDGQQLGQALISKYYVRLQELMEARRAKDSMELYNYLNEIYPRIHQRVPQNIVASFLGISPVHLSRLKSKDVKRG